MLNYIYALAMNMRVLLSGRALASQANGVGSIPITRSKGFTIK
jgi:hypothetical protein